MGDERIIKVSESALQQLLSALCGPPHLVHELIATMDLPLGMSDDNPINILIKQFNEQHGGKNGK